MNVLYVGIDNPIKVSCEGLSSAEYQVKSDQGTLTNVSIGSYTLNVNTPGEVFLTVSTNGKDIISISGKTDTRSGGFTGGKI